MTENPKHYSNIDRPPHKGDRARLVIAPGRFGGVIPVSGNDLAQVGNGRPSRFELVQPWWDVDAKPGAQWKARRDGRVRIKRSNGRWSIRGSGVLTALELEHRELKDKSGPGEQVTPEPKFTQADDPFQCDPKVCYCKAADFPHLKSDDHGTVEPPKSTGQPTGLTKEQSEAIREVEDAVASAGWDRAVTRLRAAFPEVFTEPEPGADIPDEVVDEALDSFMNALEGHERPKGLKVRNFMRAALAAADAKRAELEGGERA